MLPNDIVGDVGLTLDSLRTGFSQSAGSLGPCQTQVPTRSIAWPEPAPARWQTSS